jgi:hypothetical protein
MTHKNGISLLPLGDARALLLDRVESREWWIFVSVGSLGAELMEDIEGKHYRGKANRDFEMVVLPALGEGLGIVCLALARKSRMSKTQLLRIFDRHDMPHEAEMLARGKHDVIGLVADAAVGYRLQRFLTHVLYSSCVDEEG